MNHIELRHLRYFVALAEDLSFTRAATRLRIAQPSLSLQIQQLEDHLGCRLLTRKPRPALTPAGVAFLTSAMQLLRHSLDAVETARKIAEGKRAVLHLGLSSSAALSDIPAKLSKFMAKHPEIELRISEMHSAEQLNALRQGIIDAGISRETTTEATFTVHELLREPLLVVLPRNHSLATEHRIRLERCSKQPFVLFPRAVAPMLRDEIDTACRESGFTPQVKVEAREWHTIMAFVAAGLGIALAPASVATLSIRGAVTRRLVHARTTALFFCYPRKENSDAICALAAFLCQRAKRHLRQSVRR